MRNSRNIISAIPLFSGLSEDQLKDLTQIALDKHVGKGQTIFSEGDEANGFMVFMWLLRVW